MGTRGIYGFRKNRKDKITYNHFDSYPDVLGSTMLGFCAATSIEEMNSLYDRIELVHEEEKPTPEQIEAYRRFANTSVSTGRVDDWYCLLRELQGEPDAWKSIDGTIYMIDSHDFIINLDTNRLEFWEGYQKTPSSRNRYGSSPNEDGYYPCRMAASYPLDSISRSTVQQHVADMNKKSGS